MDTALSKMPCAMARFAQGNENLFGVVSRLAVRREVVDLKICSRSAVSAMPSVALKYAATQPAIVFRFKP